jgi:hypothetical protein
MIIADNHLPLLATFYVEQSEDKIERMAERYMDVADSQLMSGAVTQEAYDIWCKCLHDWVSGRYLYSR